MKRTLALTAATAALLISLTACGAERNISSGDSTNVDPSASNSMQSRAGESGSGTSSGASANQNSITDGLDNVSGAIYRGQKAMERGLADLDKRDTPDSGALDSGSYSAAYQRGASRGTAQARTTSGNRLERMLENARVHDSDGFLLDGENSSWGTL